MCDEGEDHRSGRARRPAGAMRHTTGFRETKKKQTNIKSGRTPSPLALPRHSPCAVARCNLKIPSRRSDQVSSSRTPKILHVFITPHE